METERGERDQGQQHNSDEDHNPCLRSSLRAHRDQHRDKYPGHDRDEAIDPKGRIDSGDPPKRAGEPAAWTR